MCIRDSFGSQKVGIAHYAGTGHFVKFTLCNFYCEIILSAPYNATQIIPVKFHNRSRNMSNDFNNSESPRIADGAFEAFIENELLPQVGLSRSAFDNLLNQLNIASLSET